jgi:hypothetical protein
MSDIHFVSYSVSPMSLRQLYFDKNKSLEGSRGEMVLTNYFDKNLIEKRSILFLSILVNEWRKDDVS